MSKTMEVHAEDVEQLLKIRRYLIGFRITNGWTQRDLSLKINGTDGGVYDLESSDTWQWRFSRLQDWVTPFGLRLDARLSLPRTLLKSVESHPEVAPFLVLSQTQAQWKTWQRVYLTAGLSVARKRLRISSVEMGRRLGITPNGVRGWERNGDDVMLPRLLMYARLIGGMITLNLKDDNAVPGCKS